MSDELQQITIRSIADLYGTPRQLIRCACSLYEDSFPYAERRSYDSIRTLLQRAQGYEIRLYVDSRERLVGLLILHHLSNGSYIEYLCTPKELRGQGLGARLINDITQHSSNYIVLEVEHAHISPWAMRRINFYKRLGFKIIEGGDYYQPAYHPDSSPVQMMLMTYGPSPAYDEIERLLYSEAYEI